jgi:hypothetical protein
LGSRVNFILSARQAMPNTTHSEMTSNFRSSSRHVSWRTLAFLTAAIALSAQLASATSNTTPLPSPELREYLDRTELLRFFDPREDGARVELSGVGLATAKDLVERFDSQIARIVVGNKTVFPVFAEARPCTSPVASRMKGIGWEVLGVTKSRPGEYQLRYRVTNRTRASIPLSNMARRAYLFDAGSTIVAMRPDHAYVATTLELDTRKIRPGRRHVREVLVVLDSCRPNETAVPPGKYSIRVEDPNFGLSPAFQLTIPQ